MDSIQGWVDKEHVKELAEKLIAPVESDKEVPKGGFAEMKTVERVVDINAVKQGSEVPPVSGVDKAQTHLREPSATAAAKKATSMLAQAKELAEKSGAIGRTDAVSSISENTETVTEQQIEQVELSSPEEQAVQQNQEIESNQAKTPTQSTGALAELDSWLSNELKSDGLCVIDRDGDVLYDRMDNSAWRSLAVSLCKNAKCLHLAAEGEQSSHTHIKITGNKYLQLVTAASDYGLVTLGILLEKPLTEGSVVSIASKARSVLVS